MIHRTILLTMPKLRSYPRALLLEAKEMFLCAGVVMIMRKRNNDCLVQCLDLLLDVRSRNWPNLERLF
jgi:hypothetical protein